MHEQIEMFAAREPWPEGFRYREDVVPPADEAALIAEIERLPFREFEFQGHLGKRRVVSFGWRYDFDERTLQKAGDLPDFLLALRERAAAFAEMPGTALQQALVSEYRPGAGIGWHRDKAMFGDVVGISLVSPCRLRLRRSRGAGWERASITAVPRSAYLLRGPSRTEWEHSVPPVEALRYSVTFRNFREA